MALITVVSASPTTMNIQDKPWYSLELDRTADLVV